MASEEHRAATSTVQLPGLTSSLEHKTQAPTTSTNEPVAHTPSQASEEATVSTNYVGEPRSEAGKANEGSEGASNQPEASGAIQPSPEQAHAQEEVTMNGNTESSDVHAGDGNLQAPSTTVPESQEAPKGEATDPVATGGKREHQLLSPGAERTPDEEQVSESAAKKQKTNEGPAMSQERKSPASRQKQPAVPAQNGEKKGGRAKKVKESLKKAIPTEGIGSRTRSRTKPSA